MEQSDNNKYRPTGTPSGATNAHLSAFGVNATTPPPTDPQATMQRADEVNIIQRMLGEGQTSAVILTGSPGAGKSMLAALLYRRFQLARQTGLPTPRHLIWLTLGTYSTLPDIIAAILNGVEMKDSGIFLLKPEQQIARLQKALRRQQDNALVVLDQFELLLHPETNQGVAGRGVLPLFLDMLQTDLGASRFLLTSYSSPYGEQNAVEARIRPYLVSRISLPEGVALLQRRGLQGSPEELSNVWQHCMGQVYALVLFTALIQLSGISLSYVLTSPDYQPVWAGDVTTNLIASVYYFFNPIQRAIIHVLSLFDEPAPLEGVIMTITGNPTMTSSTNTPHAVFEQELTRLSRVGIIQPLLNNVGIPSYTIHPLLRQYVLEHFLDEGVQDSSESHPRLGEQAASNASPASIETQRIALAAGHTQVAGYYRYSITKYCLPSEQRSGLHDIAPIIATIRHLCLGWRWQQACDLLFEEQLHESMIQWGAWNTLIGLYTAMLPPFGVLQRSDEGLITSHVAMLYGRIGEQQQSKTYFEQALSIQRQVHDARGEAATLTNQGELLRVRGELDQARTNLEQALMLNEQGMDEDLQCVILHNLGLLSHQIKNYPQALHYYTESLKLACNLGKKHDTGMILTNLGTLLYEQRKHQEALSILLAALQLRQELEDPTATMLERFLIAIEQKMGSEAYTLLYEEALLTQQDVFSRFVPAYMRQ